MMGEKGRFICLLKEDNLVSHTSMIHPPFQWPMEEKRWCPSSPSPHWTTWCKSRCMDFQSQSSIYYDSRKWWYKSQCRLWLDNIFQSTHPSIMIGQRDVNHETRFIYIEFTIVHEWHTPTPTYLMILPSDLCNYCPPYYKHGLSLKWVKIS